MDMAADGRSRTCVPKSRFTGAQEFCRLTYVRHKESLTRIFLPPNLSLSGLIARVWVVVSTRTLPVALALRGLGVGHLGFDEGILA